MTTQTTPNDLDLRVVDGQIEMYDDIAGDWFPVTDPAWGLSPEQLAEVQALPDVTGRNLNDLLPGATPTPSVTLEAGGPDTAPFIDPATVSAPDPSEVPPRPEGWVGPWPPMKKESFKEKNEFGEFGSVDREVEDWDAIRKAVEAQRKAQEEQSEATQGRPVFPGANGKQQAQEFIAENGIPGAAAIYDYEQGGWTVGPLSEATDPLSSAPVYTDFSAAQASAPQGYRVIPRTASNGATFWTYERVPEQAQQPLSFAEEMDKKQADAFRSGNFAEVLRLESFRDEIARQPQLLDVTDAASYAARFAQSPEEFIALTKGFAQTFQQLSGMGVKPQDFITQQMQGPFDPLAGIQPGGGRQTQALEQAALTQQGAGPIPQLDPHALSVEDVDARNREQARAQAEAITNAEGPFDDQNERDAFFNGVFTDELSKLGDGLGMPDTDSGAVAMALSQGATTQDFGTFSALDLSAMTPEQRRVFFSPVQVPQQQTVKPQAPVDPLDEFKKIRKSRQPGPRQGTDMLVFR